MRLKQREIWKVHPEFTDYEISNFGKARRITKARNKKNWLERKERILKISNHNSGYLQTSLTIPNTRGITFLTHRLVLETFVGPCPKNYECNHKDGNKKNNFVSNLEWVTSKENSIHSIKNRLQINPRGEGNNNSKLKDGEVWLIKKLLSNKIPQNEISKMFKVSNPTISDINREHTWRHIKYQEEVLCQI